MWLQLLASSILNTNSLRAVVAGFRVDAVDNSTEEEIPQPHRTRVTGYAQTGLCTQLVCTTNMVVLVFTDTVKLDHAPNVLYHHILYLIKSHTSISFVIFVPNFFGHPLLYGD